MIGAMRSPAQQLVTVFGGSGFLGRLVVRRARQARLPHPRRDAPAGPRGHLQPLGSVGQIHAVQANLRHPASVGTRLPRADHVINLVGILQESGRQSFDGRPGRGRRG